MNLHQVHVKESESKGMGEVEERGGAVALIVFAPGNELVSTRMKEITK